MGLDVQAMKERRYGHKDIWECTLNEFVDKVTPEIKRQVIKNNISKKTWELAIQFLRIKFDKKELAGTIEYEVANCIQEAAMYWVNCKGEDC